MQVRAIIEAAIDCKKRGVKVFPEIMHPLTLDKKELKILEEATAASRMRLFSRLKLSLTILLAQ